MTLVTRFLKWCFCSFLYKVELHNEEILYRYPSYIICPNHSCVFDPVYIYPGQFEGDVSIIAKEDLYKYAWFRWLAKKYNVFAINREKTDVRSMLKSLDVFKKNEKAKLILFPEGKVIVEEENAGKVYKKGAAFIAAHVGKPIIPAYITRRPKFFSHVDITFGEPFFITKEDIKGMGNIEKKSMELIEKIYALKGEK